ncbi:cell division protein FtsK [Micromonospora sp. 4G57]|uniref:Cell division protein FtsK n=1 Tax=Micromonospora sicca TaxID=2202420 RepID=A0ABU5JAY8_9ACTN|nr:MULTISPECIES: FtsK/SpoIIIE domain-containing protein [unclassified Micromonospora]MDZ5443786.1 cell division protein FtsK [Micromonospora sp. 4G57]MDZ5489696.1 cell division protein FtsK [Micromonospora sp. 4G53]
MTTLPMEYDDERHVIEADQRGGPVDAPDRKATFADVVSRDEQTRPIVPAVLRSPEGRRALVRWSARYGANRALYHVTRSPKYGVKVAAYAPRGMWRAGTAVLWWAAGGRENFHLRQEAANKNDPHTWQSLNRTRAKESSARWWVVGAGLVLLLAALIGAELAGMPPVGWWAAVVGMVLVAARLGRPADKPIVDRVTTGQRFTKLTAEMVRNAVVALSIGVKEPGQLTFPPPGIHKDGPGWLARFNLPGAIVATTLLEKRDNLAAALRLPVDQVWPEVGPDHPGQVDLWVGYQPSSKMGQPRWALAADNARTSVFEAQPFATDARQRPLSTVLFARNFLIGGQPGSGKSYAARTLLTIAMLDPTVELKVAEFKGVGDFLDMSPLCSTYVVGVDDEAFETGSDIITWALAECERRGKRILEAKKRGEAPEGKVTPELAAKRGSGLHPVFILLDEVHELFAAVPGAAAACERAIKRGRALGIIFCLATQIPDKDSLPPNITRCITTRWCLSVLGQVENDMILGTGAYKRGFTGTVYRPGVDAGWGVMVGVDKPGSARSFFPKPEVTAAIVARAGQLRGQVVGEDVERVEARDMLADARAVLRPGEAGVPWAVLAERLAELAPEMYAGYTADMVRESLARYGVDSMDVKVGRKNLKGARRTSLDAAQQRREIEAE